MSLDLAVKIAESIRAANGRALVVGGWVRYRLLDVPSSNVDIEVFGVPADDSDATGIVRARRGSG
jgi:tRNA nucleotidyltransferase/poly(A) polymerase